MNKLENARPKLLLVYNHRDAHWKDLLMRYIRVLERQELVDVSAYDLEDQPALTEQDYAAALRQADIAILFLSPDYLASDYAATTELPLILSRHRAGDLIVLPILVAPTQWTHLAGLAETQFLNDPLRPLSTLTNVERAKAIVFMAGRIEELAQALRQRKATIADRQRVQEPETPYESGLAPPSPALEFFISHSRSDGDFAELLKLRLKEKKYGAWIDVDRLSPGVDWRQDIDDAVKRAAAVIAVMSVEARQSEYVTYEWAFAWGAGVKIIPIMLRETPMHPRLATLQYLDFTNRIARPWDRLFAVLDEIRRPQTEVPTATR